MNTMEDYSPDHDYPSNFCQLTNRQSIVGQRIRIVQLRKLLLKGQFWQSILVSEKTRLKRPQKCCRNWRTAKKSCRTRKKWSPKNTATKNFANRPSLSWENFIPAETETEVIGNGPTFRLVTRWDLMTIVWQRPKLSNICKRTAKSRPREKSHE